MSDRLHEVARAAFPDRSIETTDEQVGRPGNRVALVRFADGGSAYLETDSVSGTALAERWTREDVDTPTEELAAWVREEFDSGLARIREA